MSAVVTRLESLRVIDVRPGMLFGRITHGRLDPTEKLKYIEYEHQRPGFLKKRLKTVPPEEEIARAEQKRFPRLVRKPEPVFP